MKIIRMKFGQLSWMLCALLLALPSLGNAEIYKWKDKNGTTRYSDTPPPSNIKQEAIGSKKLAKPAAQVPAAPVANEQPSSEVKEAAKDSPPVPGSADEEAAALRQRNAEAEKNNKQEKETEAQRKAENCKVAKARYETFKQGGRVYKINEKGEREYMGDKDLQEGKAQAQQEINENCN
jgi:Domain of unknown function (DUF4124)